ncbi:TonB-dependent receptor [Limibacter armeniacum]|uniref:TonB-dependent receptor plug domain-containing protein n=1 Tax=Limibacter armeniacum TaxID=466084 RepID=UPI002FE6372D
MRYLLLSVFLMAHAVWTYAQSEKDTTTIELEEVTIIGTNYTKYATGSAIIKADSGALARIGYGSVSDYLTQYTPIYLKEQGNGMLSTISVRGTTPNHTSVMWMGLNLNSLTLGHSDFNDYPLFFFDDLQVHMGGGSALFGSDAMGGSIVLSNSQPKDESIHLKLRQDYGSFTHSMTGVQFAARQGKWTSQTKLFYRYNKNDFPFENTAKFGKPEEKQENASFQNFGLLQQFGYQAAPNTFVSLSGWYQKNDREIQPVMSANGNSEADDLMNKWLRIVAKVDHQGWAHYSASAAFVQDHQLYESDIIETNRGVFTAQVDKTFNNYFSVKTGGTFMHIQPSVDSYPDSVGNENRTDVYASFKFTPFSFWEISLNARQGFVTGFEAPFSPSIGTQFLLVDKGQHELKLRGSFSKNYRIPTLNDRYWEDWGNPAIQPESGLSTEVGIDYIFNTSNTVFSSSLTAYQGKVTDLIQWIPVGNIWTPKNVSEVANKGVEFSSNIDYQTGNATISLGGNYAFTLAEVTKASASEQQTVGRQLAYQPKHRFNVYASYRYKSIGINLNNYFVGQRNGYDINDILDKYFISDLSANWNTQLNGKKLSVTGKVNNLFNTTYQNMKFRAMPGRNYMLSILWNIL